MTKSCSACVQSPHNNGKCGTQWGINPHLCAQKGYIFYQQTNPIPPAKPPLGVMPEFIWVENRINDLCRAMADAEAFHEEWAEELGRHLNKRNSATRCTKDI